MWICSATRPDADPVAVRPLPHADRQCFENYFLHGKDLAQFEAVLAKLRQQHYWLMCDCQAVLENGQPDPAQAPLFFPRKIDDRIRLVRNTARPPHHDRCPFYFDPTETTRHAIQATDGQRRLPVDRVLILRNPGKPAPPTESLARTQEERSQLPEIARLLWTILDRAELNIIHFDRMDKMQSGKGHVAGARPTIATETAKLRTALAGMHAYTDGSGVRHSLLEISKTYAPALVKPEGSVSEIYQLYRIHAGNMAKAKKRPQVFFFGYVNEVGQESIDHPDLPEDFHIGTKIKTTGVAGPAGGAPYLVAIVFGQRADTRRFSAIQAFAQPIYEAQHRFAQFAPVASAIERQCLHMLKSLQFVVMRVYPHADVIIRKPLFSITTPEGYYLPNFILDVTAPTQQRLSFFIELADSTIRLSSRTKITTLKSQPLIGPVLTVKPQDIVERVHRSTRDRLIDQMLSAFRC